MKRRRPPSRKSRLLGVAVGVVVFIGCVLGGYAAWALWGTSLATSDSQQTHRQALQRAWTSPPPPNGPNKDGERESPPAASSSKRLGDALALIRIPALGADWEWVVLEGTDQDTLTEGIGHQPGSAAPGQIGNFVLAGHRATRGAPFADLPGLSVGDRIDVESREAIYTYRITRTTQTTPNDLAVLAPVPQQPRARPSMATITLITCTPRWGSSGRWISIGELATTRPKTTAGPESPDLAVGGSRAAGALQGHPSSASGPLAPPSPDHSAGIQP